MSSRQTLNKTFLNNVKLVGAPALATLALGACTLISDEPSSEVAPTHETPIVREIEPTAAPAMDKETLMDLVDKAVATRVALVPATPQPPAPAPTAMPPQPTNTPLPPQATHTPLPLQPTNTPLPLQPTNTPLPPQATHTPLPPQPTNTPLPPQATHTPLPTSTPQATYTPRPTNTPKPTNTPVRPTATPFGGRHVDSEDKLMTTIIYNNNSGNVTINYVDERNRKRKLKVRADTPELIYELRDRDLISDRDVRDFKRKKWVKTSCDSIAEVVDDYLDGYNGYSKLDRHFDISRKEADDIYEANFDDDYSRYHDPCVQIGERPTATATPTATNTPTRTPYNRRGTDVSTTVTRDSIITRSINNGGVIEEFEFSARGDNLIDSMLDQGFISRRDARTYNRKREVDIACDGVAAFINPYVDRGNFRFLSRNLGIDFDEANQILETSYQPHPVRGRSICEMP